MILIRSRADDPTGLIYDQEYRFFLLSHRLSVTDHLLSRADLHSHHSNFTIHHDFSILHKPVCLSSRADACITQIFI